MPDEIKDIYDHGKELFEKGDYAAAEGPLREVLKHSPRYADVHNKLGVITSLKGSLEEAVNFFEEALRLNPLYTEAALNLTVTYNEMGLPDKAIEVVERASRSASSLPGSLDPFVAGKLANEHYKLGNLYVECNLPDDAIVEFRKAIKLRAGLADVHTKLGIALRQKGRFEDAVEEFRAAKEANRHFGPARVQLGLTYHMQGRKDLAFKEWDEALKANPDLKEARSFLNIFRDRA